MACGFACGCICMTTLMTTESLNMVTILQLIGYIFDTGRESIHVMVN